MGKVVYEFTGWIPNVLSRGSLVCIKNLQNVYIFKIFLFIWLCWVFVAAQAFL